MYKQTPKELAEIHAAKREKERQQELAAAQRVLHQRVSGVSGRDRMAVLATGTGALAGLASDKLLHRHDPWLLKMKSEPLLDAAKPHASLPAMLDAAGMFQQAEQLCLQVRQLPDAEMWTRGPWGAMTCSPTAKTMCAEAVELYKRAIAHKYLPAYAPLAWMMSYSYPDESLTLCDACIVACDARIDAPFARKAKTDCTALRAFVQCEKFISTQHPNIANFEISAKPPMKELNEIELHSTRDGSKYGYALRWMLLTFQDELDDPELMMQAEPEKAEEAQKAAEDMGLDFQRCRFCFK